MNTRHKKIEELRIQIINNENEKVITYYGICLCQYLNLEQYLSQLEHLSDKIALAQWANNFELVNKMISDYQMSETERKKYDDLLSKNQDLNETLNIELLSEKYSFLDDMLDMITTDLDVQQQLIGLSDEGLELFKKLYSKITEITDYKVSLVSTLLRTISYTPIKKWQNEFHKYDDLFDNMCELIKNDYPITDDNLEKLLYLFTTTGVTYTVSNIWELNDFGKPDSKDNREIAELIEEESKKEVKDINNIKFALLLKTFGISISKAKEICTRYDVSNLEVTEENKDVIEMYQAILQIYSETDADLLIRIYQDFTKEMNPPFDCLRMVTFENDLRKSFARELNNQVYKTDASSVNVDGVYVYEAGTDFKMIVTAIGAYQNDFENKENYSEYWNSPSIRSHSNCCSLIANNNLSTAPIKNIVLGFSTMSDNMLLLSGEKDINSTPSSKSFNTTEAREKYFISPSDMIDNTRGDYNELVYERRDLSGTGLHYKKNPDYIVFIEEYENIDEYIDRQTNEENKTFLLGQKQEQERMWQESLKAAKDFGVPIVKINREKCAKNEISVILKNLELYKQTYNPELLSLIITQFENNRVGNSDPHKAIRANYFSEKNMENILHQVFVTINSLSEEEIKKVNINALKHAIITEKQRVAKCEYARHNKQTSSFDFDNTLNIINDMELGTYSNSVSISEGVVNSGKTI